MKKTIAIIMILGLIFTLLSGCSKKKDKEEEKDITTDNNTAMGRYVEEDIAFPGNIKAEEYLTLAINPEGSLELYVYHENIYEKYIYSEDKNWVNEASSGLEAFDNLITEVYIENVFYGEDGRQYLLGNNAEYHHVLYRLGDQGEFEKLAIAKFDELYEDYDPPFAKRAKTIKVLENGMIAVLFITPELVILSPDGQTVVEELSTDYNGMITAKGNVLYYTNQNDELLGINPETGEEKAPIKMDITNLGANVFDSSLLESKEDSLFLCNKNGIHTYQLEGSIWETIVDGSQTSLSMPTHTLDKFLIGKEDDFYIVMRKDTGAIIKHIYFDTNAAANAQVELTIFSMEDNMAVRQAVGAFNTTHTDVKINYRIAKTDQTMDFSYGIKNMQQSIPDGDYINALNTELLAGRGADILILDNLSYSSYIEKGVLEDITDIFKPMIESGELLPNIAENYMQDGKVYVMPARIKLPVIYGKSDAVKAADSLQSLAEYAGKGTEVPLFTPIDNRAMAAWCYLLYSDQLVNDKNEIDEAKLQDFLKHTQAIVENTQAQGEPMIGGKNNTSGKIIVGYWTLGDINVYKKSVLANMEVMSDFDDFAIPLTVMKEWEGKYQIVNNSYEANALIGINSAGKHKDLAREFVKLLFSEETQRQSNMDGLPVNTKALEHMVQIVEQDQITYGNQEITILCTYPTPEEKGMILEEIRSLTHPMENNIALLDMILDEAERYLRGDITVEQASQNIVSSINTYLSE
jgi:ABC-type glycerol-3-phosphate transport system substrate-binding protein